LYHHRANENSPDACSSRSESTRRFVRALFDLYRCVRQAAGESDTANDNDRSVRDVARTTIQSRDQLPPFVQHDDRLFVGVDRLPILNSSTCHRYLSREKRADNDSLSSERKYCGCSARERTSTSFRLVQGLHRERIETGDASMSSISTALVREQSNSYNHLSTCSIDRKQSKSQCSESDVLPCSSSSMAVVRTTLRTMSLFVLSTSAFVTSDRLFMHVMFVRVGRVRCQQRALLNDALLISEYFY
jgi:hypothetical protein